MMLGAGVSTISGWRASELLMRLGTGLLYSYAPNLSCSAQLEEAQGKLRNDVGLRVEGRIRTGIRYTSRDAEST